MTRPTVLRLGLTALIALSCVQAWYWGGFKPVEPYVPEWWQFGLLAVLGFFVWLPIFLAFEVCPGGVRDQWEPISWLLLLPWSALIAFAMVGASRWICRACSRVRSAWSRRGDPL